MGENHSGGAGGNEIRGGAEENAWDVSHGGS